MDSGCGIISHDEAGVAASVQRLLSERDTAMLKQRKVFVITPALLTVCCLTACGNEPAVQTGNSSIAEETTAVIIETTAVKTETTENTTAAAEIVTTSGTAAESTAESMTATTSAAAFNGEIVGNKLPTPGVHDFTLPADCPYDFDRISFLAKRFYLQQTGRSVQHAEAEKLEGNLLTIHLYDIEEFRPLDYAYYYVDYHDLKGTDEDGNPVELESTAAISDAALNCIDFGDCGGAALYLGQMNDDEDFDPYCIKGALKLPVNAGIAEKYPFLTDIPEENYVSPVGGAKGASELWMIVPRPTGQKTAIRVLNFDPQTGDPLGLVFQSAEDTPFILACNASGKPDCEITFIPEMTGVQQSFKVYLSESTYDPMCTDSKIKILNERRKS